MWRHVWERKAWACPQCASLPDKCPCAGCVYLPAVLQTPSAIQISKRQRLKVKINNPQSQARSHLGWGFCSLKHLLCLSFVLSLEWKFRPLFYPTFIQMCKFTGKIKQEFQVKFSTNKTEHNFNLVSPILVNPQFDIVSGITNLIQNNPLFLFIPIRISGENKWIFKTKRIEIKHFFKKLKWRLIVYNLSS